MKFHHSFFALVLATGIEAALRKPTRHLQDTPVFPAYNQQCRDDAGPPFLDDSETFGTNKYFDGKPAQAVGDCPSPLSEACASKPKTAAFLEGPIDCGGRGWFCRIEEETGWPTNGLTADLNFGYCNTTEGFQDDGFDRAGHCHGSESDGAFYWWVRDHWFRGYVRAPLQYKTNTCAQDCWLAGFARTRSLAHSLFLRLLFYFVFF